MKKNDAKLSRRDLLKSAGLAGAGLGLSKAGLSDAFGAHEAEHLVEPPPVNKSMVGEKFKRHERVRLAIVGVGLRGTSLLREFLAVDKVQVTAVCDIVKDKCVRAA